jgi:hypothetical protein
MENCSLPVTFQSHFLTAGAGGCKMKVTACVLLLALMTGLNSIEFVVSFTSSNLHTIPKHALGPKVSYFRRSLFSHLCFHISENRAIKQSVTCSVAHTGAEPSRGRSKAAKSPKSLLISIIKTFTSLIHGFLLFLRDVYGQFLVFFMDTLINRS